MVDQYAPTLQVCRVARLAVLGEIIRAERDRRGLSQEALADLSGLSRTHVGEIERGEVGLSFSTLEALSDGLGMPMSDIIKEYERRSASD